MKQSGTPVPGYLKRESKREIASLSRIHAFSLRVGLLLCSSVVLTSFPAFALPPPDDVPEEVLRTEIITEARSPVNGEVLTAAQYAELEERLQRDPELYNSISPQIRNIIFLLQVRRAVRRVAPFLLP